jgi:hypothetical protein
VTIAPVSFVEKICSYCGLLSVGECEEIVKDDNNANFGETEREPEEIVMFNGDDGEVALIFDGDNGAQMGSEVAVVVLVE